MIKPEDATRLAKLLAEAGGILNKGPMDWYIKELTACYELLINRFAPHKVGDSVELARVPDFVKDAPGWAHCSHWMKEGAVGIVREVKCGSRGFIFDVSFPCESWIHPIDKTEQSNPNGYLYAFGERSLRAICRETARERA